MKGKGGCAGEISCTIGNFRQITQVLGVSDRVLKIEFQTSTLLIERTDYNIPIVKSCWSLDNLGGLSGTAIVYIFAWCCWYRSSLFFSSIGRLTMKLMTYKPTTQAGLRLTYSISHTLPHLTTPLHNHICDCESWIGIRTMFKWMILDMLSMAYQICTIYICKYNLYCFSDNLPKHRYFLVSGE